MSTFDICGYNPIINDPTVNLTYDDLLAMSNTQFLAYVQHMRSSILKVWDEQQVAPSTGWTHEDVTDDFKKMVGFPVHKFWTKDDLTGARVIHNTHTMGNSVNAWNLSRMLKVRINYTEKDDGRSIYDFFAKDELFQRYVPYARRHFLRDSFYFFAQTVKRGDALPHYADVVPASAEAFCLAFAEKERVYDEYELLIEPKKLNKGYSGYADHLREAPFFILSYDALMSLAKSGVLPKITCRVIRKEKELNTEHEFHVRMYKKRQKLFPAMFKSFRVSMCQYAVNFPPLTAKLLYETFLKHVSSEQVTVWDPSAGWAGRILGAMSTQLREGQELRYVGTDPNPDFYDGPDGNVYHDIAAFYNNIRSRDSLFGEHHTARVLQLGSELVQHDEYFKQYQGTLDLVFTSPPYFNREAYSESVTQSYKRFSSYELWRDGFLRETLKTAYDWLKHDRYLLWNIADLKVGKKYLPLQQDSIAICKELGFEYIETIAMTLRGMPGANRVDENGNLTAKNMVRVEGKLYKHEPILVFYKR